MVQSSSKSESELELAAVAPLNPASDDSSSNHDERDGEQKQKERNHQLGNFQSVKEEFRSVYESHLALYDHNHPDYNRTVITMAKK